MVLDLSGQKYGYWTVLEIAENNHGVIKWLCRCDCGKIATIRTGNLRSGASKSCGCHQYDHLRNRKRNYPQDVRIKRLENIWNNMKKRCMDRNNINYKNYGGRNIKICDEWKDYVSFARWALNNGYADKLTIERINNEGNYEPSNCKWITKQEQHNNRRNSKFETLDGITKTVAEWAREYNIHPSTLYRRLNNGMDIYDAIKKPSRTRRKEI